MLVIESQAHLAPIGSGMPPVYQGNANLAYAWPHTAAVSPVTPCFLLRTSAGTWRVEGGMLPEG
jgi:hypothetical protein